MRYAMMISYLGCGFCGWQIQKNQKELFSIQHLVESALTKVAGNEKINLVAAGRTDRGVHAIGQVVHFETNQNRSENQWLLGANSLLPLSIRIQKVEKVSCKFHARYNALSRTYRYLIQNQAIKSPFLQQRSLWIKEDLDIKKMKQAKRKIIGEHNFNAFRSSICQAKNPIRTINHCKIKKISNELIVVEIKANAFLHNMVRILVSALIEVGRGNRSISYLGAQLENQKRDSTLKTISPDGLYLFRVEYPKKMNLFNQLQQRNRKIQLREFFAI